MAAAHASHLPAVSAFAAAAAARAASAPQMRGILIAATGQHVGKTTSCLGIVAGLLQRVESLAYCKPVGQQHVLVDGGRRVDKDCAIFKRHFDLPHRYEDMSPVIFPRGFTRDYLDGRTTSSELMHSIQTSVRALAAQSDFVVCEGTGHTGVGSICDLNNAQVARALGLDVVLVALGGLGSSFDELACNKAMLDCHGVRLRGVVLNQVLPDKLDMVKEYYGRALARWDVPLLGCVPYNQTLREPSINDLCKLLGASFLTGEHHSLRHFTSTRLAVGIYGDAKPFVVKSRQLVVTHSSRMDIVEEVIANHEASLLRGEGSLQGGLILTGGQIPPPSIIQGLRDLEIPCLMVPNGGERNPSFEVLTKISEFTSKLNVDDGDRLEEAISHMTAHMDIDAML